MAHWLMKTGEDEHVEWSTIVDDFISDFMSREEAVAESGEERVLFTDKHLCSCRARLGERVVERNGRTVHVGGDALAYEFVSYEEVRSFLVAEAEHRDVRTWDELLA